MPILCKKAEQLGADALLFVQGRIYFATNYGPRPGELVPTGAVPTLTQVNTFNPESFAEGVTILAIKWIGEPPPGLPARHQKQPTSMEPVTPAEPTTAPAPKQTEPPPPPAEG
ncbi:MAG: hypothetical protein N3A53_04775 [Verrucomicrobiae bacterium]|nr:hypothetical protein [Verrucomicrobiae bacterium]